MKELFLALAVTHALDLATTCSNLRGGAVEANAWLPNSCAGIAAVSTAGLVGQGLILSHLGKSHPTIAKHMVIGLVGLKSFTVGWNLKVGAR